MKNKTWTFGGLLLSFSILGCVAGSPSPLMCGPTEPEIVTDAIHALNASTLAGNYSLVMVSQTEGATDTELRAALTLLPNADSMQTIYVTQTVIATNARAPLYGYSDLDPAIFGGPDVGPTDSRDPSQPGVLAIESTPTHPDAGTYSLTLRFGADANRRDVTRFDGGYFAMRILGIDVAGFRGTWATGMRNEVAKGYFCAFRKA